ncbi:MAG: CCA tRNA nucleotidyltransferase [Armatimonadota bacterium]
MDVADTLARIPRADVLLEAVRAAGTPGWVVGGTMRDLLLDRAPVDVDIATPEPESLARQFADILDGHVVPMDTENGVWRVGISSREYADFCRFRDTDIIGDLRGRDFTINAIAFRLPDADDPGGLLDPFHGLEDLQNRLLRQASPHAFSDDPGRILRAFRFVAELHLTIDTDTWEALLRERDRLHMVAPERLLAEWWKLCGGPFAPTALQRMDEAGVLTRLFPELAPGKGAGQNAYHRLDVWQHELLAATLMSDLLQEPEDTLQDLLPHFAPILDDPHRRARMVFLALIHDVGKPATRTVKQGRVHFYGHEQVGAELARRIANRLRMSNEDTRAITTVIRHHLRPLFLQQAMRNGKLSRRSMIKYFDETGSYALDVLLLAMADRAAGRGPAADPDAQEHLHEMCCTLLAFYDEVYRPSREHPLISGSDLIGELDMPPGPGVGALLKQVRARQLQGELTSHEEAMRWAAGRVKRG